MDDHESKADWDNFIKMILPLISDIKTNSKPGDRGERECPKCNKRLRWVRVSSNGHLHMACETEKCIAVME